MTSYAIIVFNQSGLATARRLQEALENTPGGAAVIWGYAPRVTGADRTFTSAGEAVRTLYGTGQPIIGLCAAGILIRILAPLLTDKRGEPPVLAVSDDGEQIVPLLGGLTGANDLAHRLAAILGGTAAVTGSGARKFGVALEAPPTGYVLANPGDAKRITSDVLSGAKVALDGSAAWLEGSSLPFVTDEEGPRITLRITPYKCAPDRTTLVYHPRSAVISIPQPNDFDERLFAQSLNATNIAPQAIAGFLVPKGAPINTELHRTVAELGAILRRMPSDKLREAALPGLLAELTGEEISQITCTSVAVGTIGIAPAPVDMSRLGAALGTLAIVGLGPGARDWLTMEARDVLASASDLVGYQTYLDLVPDLGPLVSAKQKRHASGNRVEIERARQALDLAAEGKDVVLVSSGDPGIFAMASAVMEVLEADASWADVAVRIVPGISAMQAAAARMGAPLGHDFCVISLSDIRKPWPVVAARLEAALRVDFVIALYNPASTTRRQQLEEAFALVKAHRDPLTPIVVGQNLGRPGEFVRHAPLKDVPLEDIDMRTVVLIGSNQTRAFQSASGTQWVYTPRSYPETS